MSNIRLKLNNHPVISAIIACAMLGMMPSAFGQYFESFESGTLDGWNADAMNGTTGLVNTDRASDGIYSYGNTFTVPASFAGYSVTTILDYGNARDFIDAGTTSLSLDAYSNWTNPNGWSLYDNSIKLVLNYQGGYQVLDAASGSLVNGSFEAISFDLSPWATTITAPGLSYSQLQIAWKIGTYGVNDGLDGLDNGTQTLAIDKITTVEAVPEPATAALAAMAGTAFMFLRRRSVR